MIEIVPVARVQGDAIRRFLCSVGQPAYYHWLAMAEPRHVQDYSFFVREQDQFRALVPMPVEDDSGGSVATFFGVSVPGLLLPRSALSPEAQRTLVRAVVDEIDRRARQYGIVRVAVNLEHLVHDPLVLNSALHEFYRAGYLDISQLMTFVDLSLESHSLLARMRKGHRSAIKSKFKAGELDFVRMNQGSHPIDSSELNRMLAKEGFSPALLQKLYESYRAGNIEFLIMHDGGKKKVAQACFLISGEFVEYFAAERSGEKAGSHNILLWHAIQIYKALGMRYLSLGICNFGSTLSYQPSAKSLAIASFKRGFGGEIVSFPCVEKFYSALSFEHVLGTRVKRFANAAFGVED